MSSRRNISRLLKRFINFITFVDLPIKKKFILFFIGVFFWFVTMFVVSIVTMVHIKNVSDAIVNHVIPHDKITQKVIRKLQRLETDAVEIAHITDEKSFEKQADISRLRIMDIRSFLSALLLGGTVNDIDRDSGSIIESFTVEASGSDIDDREFADTLNPVIDRLDKTFGELADTGVAGTQGRKGILKNKTDELRGIIHEAKRLAADFYVRSSGLYALNLNSIKHATGFISYTVVGILLIASVLLGIFTVSISRSIAKPVKSIISQIRSLGEGEVDLTRRIEITSKDEIGTLSNDFNELMEEIHGMATFKKVIEEDDMLEDVYSRLGNVFADNLGLYDFMIYEVSNSQNKMKPVYPVLLKDGNLYCDEEILHNCNICRAKKTGHTISSVEYPHICRAFREETEKLHVCIPMIVGGSTGGVVQFLFDRKYADLNHRDRRIFKAEQYIKEALSVIEAKRLTNTLRESALKDSLTGLYNRRFLQEYTETLVAGAQRRGKTVGLIMCDLDYFKQVNDVYGHNVGDSVLKETSNIISRSVRESDLVIRFGGEEFLVVLLDITDGDAFNVAEKIRETMQEAKIKVSDGIIKKTISLGISEFPVDTQSFWQAIKFADVALYNAKETGRNRTVRFTTEMWKEEQF